MICRSKSGRSGPQGRIWKKCEIDQLLMNKSGLTDRLTRRIVSLFQIRKLIQLLPMDADKGSTSDVSCTGMSPVPRTANAEALKSLGITSSGIVRMSVVMVFQWG